MKVTTRICNQDDVDKVAKVLVDSGLAKVLEDAPNLFLNELKKGDHYIIAEDENGNPLGIVSWIMHGELRHELCELYHIAVISEAQGKGVAPLLFQALIDDANSIYEKHGKKLRKLYLLTHADSERAHGFYKKMGMVQEATLKEHFRKGLDEFVFSKTFD